MGKTFNTDGYCDPKLHYMVNLDTRLREIKSMVDAGSISPSTGQDSMGRRRF